MPEQIDIDIDMSGGYWPSASGFAPDAVINTIRSGVNVWVRAGNRFEVVKSPAQTSATNVGARLFPLNDTRASIGGGLVSGRLPYAGLIRYLGGTLLYLSELTGQQVFINETAAAGVTTASSAGILRVAVPSGGGYNVYDAGFNPIVLPSGNVTTPAGGTKGMSGDTGVALCPWRTITNAIGAPSNTVVVNLAAGDTITIALPAMVSGQDGWIYAGTAPGVTSTQLRVIRYVRTTIRGTFTATAGSPNLTAGVGTFMLEDLRAGDVVTIDGGSYTVQSVTAQGAATLTTNFAGVTNSGKTATITSANAEWFGSAGEQGDRGALIDQNVFKPPRAAGALQFMGRTFLWGTDGPSGAVTGPGIRLMLADNPEHVGLTALTTTYGDDLLNVFPANDQRSKTFYLMTRNTLELLEFNDVADDPYRVRVIKQPGFSSAKGGIVYKNVFYGYDRQPLRTVVNGDIDTQFAQAVLSDMDLWTPENVVMGSDANNDAVLYCHWNASDGYTTVIPYLVQLGVWSTPIRVFAQVVDIATVNGTTYLSVLTGGNYRVWTWEGGSGTTTAPIYIASQFRTSPESDLFQLKNVVFTGNAGEVYVYIVQPGAALPDMTSTSAAYASFTPSTGTPPYTATDYTEAQKYMNTPPVRGIAFRVDFPFLSLFGNMQRLTARGFRKVARR